MKGQSIFFNVIFFDKWGEIVWEATDLTSTWNGYDKGQMVQSGTYKSVMVTSIESNDAESSSKDM